MGDRIIILGFDQQSTGEESDSLRQIRCSWPEDRPLEFKTVPFDGDAGIIHEAVGSAHAALVKASGISLQTNFFELWDAMQSHLVPTLVIGNSTSELADFGPLSGVVTCPTNEPPDRIAARLHTLLVRQSLVREQARELRMFRRVEGSMHNEFGRIQEELQLAAAVQREILPRSVDLADGLRIGVLYRPVGYVSGDFYAVERVSDREVGFFLADAVGHGVPAALMTMVISRSLHLRDRHGSHAAAVPPAEVMSRLNAEMLMHQQAFGGNGRFATAIYGTIDTQTRRVRFASAGHPQPLRLSGDGAAVKVPVEGAMLGIFPDEKYKEYSFKLVPGERLLIYTDGFETAFPNAASDLLGRRLPNDRYVQHMCGASCGRKHPSEAIDCLMRDLDGQLGSLHQVDDITALCIELAGQSSQVPDHLTSSAA